jgi:Tol biopolymer transport system component
LFNSRSIEIPDSISGGISQPLVAFINFNDRERASSTLEPANNEVVLYYGSPTSGSARVPVLQLESLTTEDIYIAPEGNAIAYLLQDPRGLDTGLWLTDVSARFTARVSPIRSFIQRGLFSAPSWSPDGTRLAVVLATGYDLDIFLFNLTAAPPINLTNNGSYDWSPVWSPDGRYIAFLSDRQTCPTWIPNEGESCVTGVDPAPTAGHVYVIEVETGTVTQLSEAPISETPTWVNGRLLAFGRGGNPDDLLDPSRHLFLADVITGEVESIRLGNADDDRINISESWSPDGQYVLFQNAGGEQNSLILMRRDGTLIAENDELTYPRFGMSASWSPDGQRIAIGGVGGQCPYGRTVIDLTFDFVARTQPPPSMCRPYWSPDGRFIAYTGIVPSAVGAADGRVDILISDNNGFGSTNITSDLRGQIRLLGWVGSR